MQPHDSRGYVLPHVVALRCYLLIRTDVVTVTVTDFARLNHGPFTRCYKPDICWTLRLPMIY